MSAFLAIALIHFVALASPGPDFLLITRASLTYSRRTGVWTALGLGLGMLVHVTYTLLGIGLLISQSIVLFNTIKYAGAAYLIFIGFQALTHKASAKNDDVSASAHENHLPAFAAIRMGFLTNILNPKASLFFLALFTQVIGPETPIALQIFYGVYMATATFAWFSGIASVLSMSVIRKPFARVQAAAERVFGGLLILLGLKVAFAGRD